MSTRWRSSEDVISDLTRINDFGRSNEEELKADLTRGTSRPEPVHTRFTDPRTGEEVDFGDECRLCMVDTGTRFSSMGRGRLIEEFRYSSKMKNLQKQLRRNRPMGFGNHMIEAYFGKGEDAEGRRVEGEHDSGNEGQREEDGTLGRLL